MKDCIAHVHTVINFKRACLSQAHVSHERSWEGQPVMLGATVSLVLRCNW